MATAAPITPPLAGGTPFTINGVTPFQMADAGEYIRAAHAIACLGAGNTGDEGKSFYSNDQIIAAGFDAIALLLAHAEQLTESAH